jgi:hypothetical protein
VPQSKLRDELVRRVAGRLELSERQLEALLAGPRAPGALPRSGNGDGPATSPLDQGARAERTFLVLCLAVPEAGRIALAAIDPELLTSGPLRRAARRLAEHPEDPLAGLAEDDELVPVVADLRRRAEGYPDKTADRLEHARLVLELARLDRAIRRARGETGADTSTLARERESVLKAIGAVVTRLEEGQ